MEIAAEVWSWVGPATRGSDGAPALLDYRAVRAIPFIATSIRSLLFVVSLRRSRMSHTTTRSEAEGDVRVGVNVNKRALKEPFRQIVINAGLEASVPERVNGFPDRVNARFRNA